MVLKELRILTVSYFGQSVVDHHTLLKELIFNSFYIWEGVVVLKVTDF